MHAMVPKASGRPLEWPELPDRQPGSGEIRVQVAACGVCRTDLHVVDGELPQPQTPIVPGHEIVGRIDAIGAGVVGLDLGQRVGIPWLGYTRDGGFATAAVADARFAFPLGEAGNDASLAPLLCAGLIGWRALTIAGEGQSLGMYGFAAAAHILAQVARWQGRSVFAFRRPGDLATQAFARSLGVSWAGGSGEMPPQLLDAAIIFAPVGTLVPQALKAVRKGGRVVCAGIHMSDIPRFPYSLLWEERQLLSAANLTRRPFRGRRRSDSVITLSGRATLV